jgi:aspartate aminotransferase
MKLSARVQKISESITLKLNAKAVDLAAQGKKVYNLTAGQLPFRPMNSFVDLIRSESDFIKSFQYSPVAGYPELKKKIIENFQETRGVNLSSVGEGTEFDVVVSNGGKHCLTNIFGALLDHGDEVIMFSPYWVSYPEMVKFCGANPVIVETSPFDVFIPSLEEFERKITDKTKIVVVNSPNNPTGTHYRDDWMQAFADIMVKYPEITIISDEIYYQLYYYDPKPTYFYQHRPELLERTVIVDGISKTLASTGLRIGYTIAPKTLTKAINTLQGQTTSGANSLVQRALTQFDFNQIPVFLEPIKKHLRANAEILGEALSDHKLGHVWYQPTSAFYYLIDFSQTPVIEKYKAKEEKEDYSYDICEELLEEYGIAMVPGVAFGSPNTARLSLVSEKEPFKEAIDIIMKFLLETDSNS